MADALYDAILGVQPSKNSTSTQAGGTNQFNVGNLRPAGQTTGFQQPSSYEEGIKAMDTQLGIYGQKHGIKTLRGVISRYAPSSENDTENYINFVSQKTGLKPDQEIDLNNPVVRHVISGPMMLMEKGHKGIFGQTTQSKQESSSSNDPLYNAILTGKVEEKQTSSSGVTEEDLSKPVTFNRKLARKGEKMREQGSALEGFVSDVAKPLEGITTEDYLKNSTPALAVKANLGGQKGKMEMVEAVSQSSEKLVNQIQNFYNAPNKAEIIKQGLTHLYEHPGEAIGEAAKSTFYHPEQIAIGNAAGAAGEKILAGVTKPVVKAAAPIVEKAKKGFGTLQEELQAFKQFNAPESTAMAGAPNVGAAKTANKSIIDEAMTRATPELAQELSKLNPGEINMPVLERHLDADTLPVPIRLSEGQATRDPHIFSDEMNSRGKNKQLSDRYNQQNAQLVENIDQIKENAAPRVYGTNVVENGQSLIDAYLDIDKARLANIDTKYQALRDAAGGEFPIDGVAFANNAINSLKKNLKSEFLPDSIRKQVEAFKRGEPMTFEQFEAMRTNLASEMRKADRAGDGNAEFALGKVREALEDLPLTGESKELKVLADDARAAAKERFDTLGSDKAYKAAINGKVAPDDFIQKFVINGKKNDIDTMVAHLGTDSQAREVMAAGIVNWLKSKAGISADGNGAFSQKGFNKALESIDPKILNIVGPEVNQQLKALGNTARNIQERPVGGYVNESNTLVGAMAEKAKTGAEVGLNLLGGGVVPIGTMARGAIHNVKEAQKVKKALKPGAGIRLKDIGKE